MNSIFLATVLTTLTGLFSGWIFYNFFIKNKFEKNKGTSKHAKILWWCGILGSISIAQGLGTFFNEFFLSNIAGLSFNSNNA